MEERPVFAFIRAKPSLRVELWVLPFMSALGRALPGRVRVGAAALGAEQPLVAVESGARTLVLYVVWSMLGHVSLNTWSP